MTHDEIEAGNVHDRYLMGKLAPDERTRFEEHFVDCPQCLDQLEAAERFKAALKPVVTADAARFPPTGLAANPWRIAFLAAATMAAAAAALFFGLRSTSRELDLARAASANWHGQYEQEHSLNEALRRQALAAGQISPLPVVGAVFYLNTVRGVGAADVPVDRVTMPPDRQSVIFSLDRPIPPEFHSLRAKLSEADGTIIWQHAGIQTASGQTFGLVLPSDLFREGDYTLTLEGLTKDDRYLPAGRYQFRVAMGRRNNPPPRSK